jgi:hypothetical protein
MIAIFTLLHAAAWSGEPSVPAPNVFDLPRLQFQRAVLQTRIAGLFKTGKHAEAEKHCQAAVELIPHEPNGHYNLACAQARNGKTEAALNSLAKAVELGFNNVELLRTDDHLADLREEERFQQILENAATAKRDPKLGWQYNVKPAAIVDGVATVGEDNTVWDARLSVFRTFFKLDTAPAASEPIVKGLGEAGKLLTAWQAEGTAAGNRGDLYDNHDSDHSNMKYALFPQLTRIEFAEAPKARGLHHGLQASFLYNSVTIGNSSTAVTGGPFWRSQARLALTNPRAATLLFVQYANGHLYVYPEHRDHDPGHNGKDGQGHGDVFAANTPYMIVSQGSSGSDRVFLQAVAATLAALRPEVKTELARRGGLMPTVQMIFRRCNKTVANTDDYLTGKAHPTVFDGSQVDVEKMVKLAHEITKDTLPPIAILKIVEEDQAVPGRDYFAASQSERLFDTPGAVARVVRTTKYVRRLVVSAEPSKDLNDRPLEYHWRVLRGDAERIKINKLNDAGSVAELLIPYHDRRPVLPGSSMHSNRVDIGAFVHNGEYYSVPAFVTFFYLDDEKRVYDEQQRIQVVDYADPEWSGNYVDPSIAAKKDWRDEYHYDAAGKLTGWTRTRGESQEEFTSTGLLVTRSDAAGRPVEARRVQYVRRQQPKRPPILEQQVTGDVVSLK